MKIPNHDLQPDVNKSTTPQDLKEKFHPIYVEQIFLPILYSTQSESHIS